MTSLGDITVGFKADTSSLASGFNFLRQGLGGVPGLALVAGAAVIGIGVKAAQMAGNFQESMTQLVTGAGEASSNLKMVSDGILKIAVDTGTSTKQLAAGMYMIESAGYHGAAGLNVLQVAAEGAKVGNADLGVVSNALTTILTDYHMKGTQAADAMNALTATVASGKTHLQDLAGAMGSVLPLASSLGIAFPDVGGAIATMTNAGMSAQRASMNLANAIRSLAAPGSAAQKAMVSVGIDAQGLKDTLAGPGGLANAVQFIEHMIGTKFPAGSIQAVEAFKKIMGGATGYNVALMLGGKNMDTYQQNIISITSAMQNGHGAVTGWTEVQKDFNFRMSQAKEIVETFMIRLGTALLPVLTKIATYFVSNVVPALQLFGGWIQANVMPVLLKFGQWFQANAMPALQQFATIIQNNVVPVIQNLVTIIGDALGWIKDHWTQIWGVLGPILRAVWDIVTGIIKIGWSIISGIFNVALDIIQGKWGKVWTDIKNMLGGIFDGIGSMTHGFVEGIGAAFNWLGTLLHGIWDGIVGIIKGAINLIIGLIDDFIGGIDSIGIDIGPVHVHPNIGKIPFLAGGGVVGPGQSFIAGERGAELITAGTNGASVAPLAQTGGGTHITEIYLDGLKIAQVVAPHMDALVRAKFGPRSRL